MCLKVGWWNNSNFILVFTCNFHTCMRARFKLHCHNEGKVKILKSVVTVLVTEERVLSDDDGKCTEKWYRYKWFIENWDLIKTLVFNFPSVRNDLLELDSNKTVL